MRAQIGLMVEGQFGLNWERWARVLEVAERLGFQCVFRSDHFVNMGPPDVDSLELFNSLVYAATHTKRIEFGSLVAPVTFRHPTMTVRQGAQIDDLSGGRLVLGLGAGWQEREHTMFGIPFHDFPTRFDRFEEALEISKRLLESEEPINFEGRHFSLADAQLLPRPARKTPILIGGNGPTRTLPLAARFADEWNGVFIDADTWRARSQKLDELLDAEGRDPASVKRSLMTPLATVAGDDAIEQLEAYVDAGCQRFMLQILEYDDLSTVEAWADAHLQHFHA